MAGSGQPRAPANQFRQGAKIDETALMQLAFGFCCGTNIQTAATAAQVSPKTARGIYLDFRRRIAKPAFNRWHGAYQRLATITSPEAEIFLRILFLDVLAACYHNESCYRNAKFGNRKVRLCRACPLSQGFADPMRIQEGLDIVDAVRTFYGNLGIRGETGEDPVLLFHHRLIHTTTVATALAASRGPNGALLQPTNLGFLTVWKLLDTLLLDLADRPL